MNKISDTEIVDGAQDFRFMTRQMVDAILEMSEYNRFSKGIFSWVGFRVKYMPYENVERKAGTTSWSFWGLFKFPLSLSVFLGILCIIIALIVFVVGIIVTAVNPFKAFGWYVIASTVLTVGGLIMLCLGIMGLYLAKMYLEVKKRPVYIAGETDEDYRNRKKAE